MRQYFIDDILINDTKRNKVRSDMTESILTSMICRPTTGTECTEDDDKIEGEAKNPVSTIAATVGDMLGFKV